MPIFDDAESILPEQEPEPEPQPQPVALASRLRVAFQGELGAFSEEAIHQLWRGEAEPVPVPTFEAVLDAAENGDVDFGLLPIESTLVGGLDVSYDLLSQHDRIYLVAEVVVPVHLCLLTLPGTRIGEIRTLRSHPVMLSQVSYFLDRHKHIKAQPAWDTAGAAREVKEAGDRTRAAAGSHRAAERFGLVVLQDHIEDRPDSQLRFVALAREPIGLASGVPARTAVLAVFPHGAGHLVAALQPMADAGFNLCNFASRPTREPWQYQFYIEFEHTAGDPNVEKALAGLRHASAEFRFLGTYPKWRSPDASRRRPPLP